MRRKLSEKERKLKLEEKKRINTHILNIILQTEKDSRQINRRNKKLFEKKLEIIHMIGKKIFERALKNARKYLSTRKFASKHFYGLTSDKLANGTLKNFKISKTQ